MGCRTCGVCCDLYGHTLRASATDLARWRRDGRADLLNWVGPERELWWDADGDARLDRCPFFEWRGAGGFCGIHGHRPEECRAYPTALHDQRCVMGAEFGLDEKSGGGSRRPRRGKLA